MASGLIVLPVEAPGGDYDVLLGEGLLSKLPSLLAERELASRAAIVTNDTLAPIYADALEGALPNAFVVSVPDGERYKTLDTLREIYDALVGGGLSRDGIVIALGGGVIGDMAGLAAATYMRGVRLVQVPTSLLAMVDASVGGKVAVDLPAGKNLVGAFKQPELVAIDPAVLDTLLPEELRAGMAEVVKHGLIADPELLELLESDETPDYTALISRAMQVKINIVEADPFEQGVRAHLNLGHTFAHAIEVCADYTIRHGEAVAIGMVAASHLSERLGMADARLTERVESLLTYIGLPTRHDDASPDALWRAMAHDKKARDGVRRFVLPRDAGQVEVVPDVPREDVLAVLEQLRITR